MPTECRPVILFVFDDNHKHFTVNEKALGFSFVHTCDKLPQLFTALIFPSVFCTDAVTWLLKADLTDRLEALLLLDKASFAHELKSANLLCKALAAKLDRVVLLIPASMIKIQTELGVVFINGVNTP